MVDPVNPRGNDNNDPRNYSFVDTVVFYAGRIWEWIKTSLSSLFFERAPKNQNPERDNLKDRQINQRNPNAAGPAGAIAQDVLNPKAVAPPGGPADDLADIEEPSVLGPRGKVKGAREREADPVNQPSAPISLSTIAQVRKTPRNDGEFTQITVMDQEDQVDIGFEACGYQSLKNALVGIGLAVNSKVNGTAFENPVVYNYFYTLTSKYLAGHRAGDRDVSIAVMSEALTEFMWKKNEDLPPLIRPIHEAFISHPDSVSAFNYDNAKLAGVDPSNMHSVYNLINFKRNPGPVTHSIALGGNGHWTTIILEKDSKGVVKYYGCNSYNANTPASRELLKRNIDLIKTTIENLDDYLIQAFEYSASWIRIANYFNDDGTLKAGKDPQRNKSYVELFGYINDKNRPMLIDQMEASLNLITAGGLLNNRKIKADILHLKKLTNVLLRSSKESDKPQLTRIQEALKDFRT